MAVRLGLALLLAVVACSPAPAAPAAAPAVGGATPAAAAATAAAPSREHVMVAYVAPAAVFAAPWMSKEAGLFERYGLDAEVGYVASGPTMLKAMLAGEVQFGELAAPSSMSAYVEGGDVVWITGAVNRPVLYVIAAPGVGRLEDLRGRPVGISRVGTTTHTMMKIVLRSAGLDAERDVQLVQAGGAPELVAALGSGHVDAAILGPPSHLVSLQQGMHELLRIHETGIRWPMGGSVTTRGYLGAHPEVVRNYLRAYVEAIQILRTDRERAVDVIAKYADTPDRTLAEQSWEAFHDYYTQPPYPEREAMAAVVREELGNTNPRAYDIPPEEFYDDRPLRELEQSGLIQQVMAR
jgi:ABC-type nitrate/sulfonate/bicarbonate transport system substrate-binding protein